MIPRSFRSLVSAVAGASVLIVGCAGSDDGAEVRPSDGAAATVEVIGGDDDSSASSSGSGSASAPAAGSDDDSSATSADDGDADADAGYEYATDVGAHRLVVLDVCGVIDALDETPPDFETAATVYREGGSSVNSDGSIRTLAGFATAEDRLHGVDEFYGTPTPLDDFVGAALAGTGEFAGAGDSVRAQGAEKGIRNQVMIAWVVHELNSALEKAASGDFDPAEGAVHNWDEAWAFYAGAEPEACAPYGTADSRGANFGTLADDGETSLANEAILAAMIAGRDALLAEDAEAAQVAADEVVRNVVITYSQATIRYATLVPGDLEAGDVDEAEEHRAEGYAFWRVIEPIVVPLGADGDAVASIVGLDVGLGANGGGDEIRAALAPAWEALGITDADIGTLQ